MTPEGLPLDTAGPELQRDVQRLLGRCMLRIQQYEAALKTVLAHHEVAGTIEVVQAEPALRAEKLSNQTLGNLAKLMFESFVVPEGFERELLPEEKAPTDRISFAHSFRVTLAPEPWAETREAVQQLVTLRNELVHHFLSRFNVLDEQGCATAITYRQEAYQRIDTHYRELRAWLFAMVEGRKLAASLMQTEVWQDAMFNGVNPDGSFEWRDTGIVRALRETVKTMAGDAWIELERVKRQMQELHPDQTPRKYRSTSWPQVLAECREFDLEYRVSPDAEKKQAWVRLRPEHPAGKKRKVPGRGAQTPPAALASDDA